MFNKIYVVLKEVLQHNDEGYNSTDGYEIVSCHYLLSNAEKSKSETKQRMKNEYETYDLYDFVCWDDKNMSWDSPEFLDKWSKNNRKTSYLEPLDEFVTIKEYEIK